MKPKQYATVTGIIFMLVTLAHLLRVIVPWEFSVGSWDVPSWVSLI